MTGLMQYWYNNVREDLSYTVRSHCTSSLGRPTANVPAAHALDARWLRSEHTSPQSLACWIWLAAHASPQPPKQSVSPFSHISSSSSAMITLILSYL